MALLGKGMLITFTEVPARAEKDYNEWYNREHIGERANMPGFRRARRYVGAKANPKYFATYETRRVQDLAAPGYLARLADQSPWSKQVMARFSKFERLTLKITIDRTTGMGGGVAILRCYPAPAGQAKFRRWLDAVALPKMIAAPGMVGGFLGENDLEVANAPARAGGGYPAAEQQEWLILLEGAAAAPALAVLKQTLSRQALGRFAWLRPPVAAAYGYQYGELRA